MLDAAERAGMSRQSFYRFADQDEVFRTSWHKALVESADVLEHALRKRAEAGKSDIGSIFLLKSLRPERFRDYQPPTVNILTVTLRLDRARERLATLRNITPARPALPAPIEGTAEHVSAKDKG